MGACNKRYFLLTLCVLQLITTTERQIFDFLGFMWVPILMNFFNIIYVILGFFGAFQYRPKYLIVYCIWSIIWLGWNVFLICFYLNVGSLDENSDLLNFGTGSFSWWLSNGPGCKSSFNNSTEQFDYYRPIRPSKVTGCFLDYQVIENIHSSIQSSLAVIGLISGIFLTQLFLEEDDSFDFVGGGDFGMAGHTPLHPMYVSYSALAPPAYSQKHSTDSYPTGTTSTHRSTLNSSSVLSKMKSQTTEITDNNRLGPSHNNCFVLQEDTIQSSSKNVFFAQNAENIDINDYSNPIDHLPRPMSSNDEYDSLENPYRVRYQKNKIHNSHISKYSPIPRSKIVRPTVNCKQNRNSTKPRLFADHIRENPLRSYYSDPRLAVEEQSLNRREENKKIKKDNRPISMYVNNY